MNWINNRIGKKISILSQTREGLTSETKGIQRIEGELTSIDPLSHVEIKTADGMYRCKHLAGPYEGISLITDLHEKEVLYDNTLVDKAYRTFNPDMDKGKILLAGQYAPFKDR